MATLGEKNVGDVVKINENGTAVNYLIVHKGLPSDMYDASCDGVWVLREQAHSKIQWNTTPSKNDYENSSINAWLNGTFLNTIDSKIREAIKTVKIPYKKGIGEDETQGVQSGANGLSCKVFLLGGYEVGFAGAWYPVDGAKLSYFLNGNSDANAKTKRICNDSTNTVVAWWLRSPDTGTTYNAYAAGINGAETKLYVDQKDSYAARPAFVLPPSLAMTADGFVTINNFPVITSDTASGSDMGEISAPFNFTYTVNDADNDPVTVTEYVDDVQTRTYTATLGAENTFEAVSDPVLFQKILNGQHTLKIIANDTKDDSEPYTVTFDKQVKTATISLSTPLPADDVIKAAVISVTGNIPKDATLEVLVTNNALDENPVWENMTQDYLKNINHVFANRTAVNGFAFNFKVTATRGASGEQGFISNIGGAFE